MPLWRKDNEKVHEIFKLQWGLNIFTLANTGRDFVKTIQDPEQVPVWIENYRKALSSELAELVREVRENGMDSPNCKIEIVDMLHFLVSLSHIVGVQPEETPSFCAAPDGASFEGCVLNTFLGLDDLQNSVKWKWWAKGGGYKPERARQAILALWDSFAALCALFSLDFETMKRIYIAKNQVNFSRQKQNYNEDTKTEADNLTIRT